MLCLQINFVRNAGCVEPDVEDAGGVVTTLLFYFLSVQDLHLCMICTIFVGKYQC